MPYTLFDATGANFNVGDHVNIPVRVTAISGDPLTPSIQEIDVVSRLPNPDGSFEEFGIFATTVLKDK